MGGGGEACRGAEPRRGREECGGVLQVGLEEGGVQHQGVRDKDERYENIGQLPSVGRILEERRAGKEEQGQTRDPDHHTEELRVRKTCRRRVVG